MFWRGFNETSYEWFDSLDVNTNVSFQTVANSMYNATVQVDWANHNAIMLFAHPGVQQDFDDWIRSWNSGRVGHERHRGRVRLARERRRADRKPEHPRDDLLLRGFQ